MKMRPASKECRRYRSAVALLTAILAAASTIQAQTAAPQLEVATVKPSNPAKEHLGLYWRQPDGFKREGTTLRGMIGHAYGVPSSVKGLVLGGPAWMLSDAFDVQVKVDSATTERWSKLPQQAVDEERTAVERELLAERFQLKVHREMREMPAFALTVAKGGSKLQTPVAEKDLQAGVPQNRINIYGHGHWQGHSALLSICPGRSRESPRRRAVRSSTRPASPANTTSRCAGRRSILAPEQHPPIPASGPHFSPPSKSSSV
jgi:uncharacterized protein (TIGR03435 family)